MVILRIPSCFFPRKYSNTLISSHLISSTANIVSNSFMIPRHILPSFTCPMLTLYPVDTIPTPSCPAGRYMSIHSLKSSFLIVSFLNAHGFSRHLPKVIFRTFWLLFLFNWLGTFSVPSITLSSIASTLSPTQSPTLTSELLLEIFFTVGLWDFMAFPKIIKPSFPGGAKTSNTTSQTPFKFLFLRKVWFETEYAFARGASPLLFSVSCKLHRKKLKVNCFFEQMTANLSGTSSAPLHPIPSIVNKQSPTLTILWKELDLSIASILFGGAGFNVSSFEHWKRSPSLIPALQSTE